MGKSHKRTESETDFIYTGIFSNVRSCLPMACRKTVYNAFIFSGLNYGSEIYVSTTKKYIQPLMVTQNKLPRILQFKHITTPLRDIYREFSTLKLKDFHYYNICYIAHKFIHSRTLLPEAINDIFCRNDQIQDHDTRYKKDLHPARTKAKLYGEKNEFFPRDNILEKIAHISQRNKSGKPSWDILYLFSFFIHIYR